MVVVRPYRCSSLITEGGQRHRKNSNQDFGRDFTYSRRCASAAIPTGSTLTGWPPSLSQMPVEAQWHEASSVCPQEHL